MQIINFITVEIISKYGRDHIYPVDEAAKLFARLTNNKTLTKEAISLIKKLGYEINVQPSNPKNL